MLIEDGSKAAPLGEQFFNYISKFPEKIKETDKKIMEDEVVRKRIDDSLPPQVKKVLNWPKQRPPLGFLSDKPTYSSMKKMSSKNRKLFIFDSYTTKQKNSINNQEVAKRSGSQEITKNKQHLSST